MILALDIHQVFMTWELIYMVLY